MFGKKVGELTAVELIVCISLSIVLWPIILPLAIGWGTLLIITEIITQILLLLAWSAKKVWKLIT